MRIHQLNIKYENDQDRLLARISTDTGLEMRLWLTRRLTVGILPLLRKLTGEQLERDAQTQGGPLATDPLVRQVLSEFKKEELLRQSDFKTIYKEPAGEASAFEAPLLVSEVVLARLANGNLQTKFRGPMEDQNQRKEVKLELDGMLLHGFLHLLEQAYVNSGWAVVAVTPIEPDPPAENSANHERPQYLN
jgi:hypothetical protein